MNIPVLSKRAAGKRTAIENASMAKAMVAVEQALVETGVVEKSFLTGNAATLMSGKGQSGPKQPGTSWSNQGGTSSRLIARVTQNLSEGFGKAPADLELALAEQGLSWGPPFPPGRPLDPFFGYRRPARTFDYSVGTNTQLTPRWSRVSFQTIKALYEAYDVAQICVRHLINDVRSLDYNWEPIPGVKADVAEDIEQAVAFFDSPDKRQPFRTWLAEWLQDVLRYDAGALYVRRNNAGEAIALEVISGETIIPLIDFYGRRPEDEDDTNAETEGLFGGETVPAYVQIIEGLPWDWLAADDLIYQPWNPLPESQYGLAPLEAVLLSANTDVRFQWHFLQFFTEGTMPAGFMEAPPEMSDPAQIASWQETWDAFMLGDQTKLRQVRWVPAGAKFTEAKPASNKFDSEFPLYLMRRTCASFGVTPNDLGFTENVNRATGDTQVDVQFRVGTSPLLRYAEDVINLFVRQHLKLRCRIRFDDGKETEDRVATATADGIYLDHGVIGIDEVRQELGRPVDKSKPSPRYINNSRVGPIPLLALESMSGKIDADTYGVADDQELVDVPYVAPPGVIPPAGTPELKASAETTGLRANALREGTVKTGSTADEGEDDTVEGGEEAAPEPSPAEKAIAEIDRALAAFQKIDNTGGPGVNGGISAGTGIQGSDLLGDESEDEDDEEEATKAQIDLSLRRWRENSRSRLKKGRAPRRFVDPSLPAEVHDEVWSKLQTARTREAVDAAFKATSKKASAGARPAFHSQADAIVNHYAPKIAAELGSLFSKTAIDAAIEAADAARAKKNAPHEPPHLREAADPARSCATCEMFDHREGDSGVCWGYGNWPVKAGQTCDSWSRSPLQKEASPDPAAAAAMDALREAAANEAGLKAVLIELYGDSFLQGAHDAVESIGETATTALSDQLSSVGDAGYWDAWQPGYAEAAAQAADGGMADMLASADVTIQGLTDTSIERVGNAIAEGLAGGDSFQTTAKSISDVLEDPNRAETVANTEYARAMTTASEQTFRESSVENVEWMAEGDACEECQENADAGVVSIDEGFPNGTVPVHPNCRCAVAPVVEAADGSEPEPDESGAEE